jgi:soluble lytic murein transglycosylase
MCASFAAGPARADEASALRAALNATASGDWQGALSAARGAGAVGGDIILWHWLRAGEGKLGDYEAFLARRPDWPGLPLLKEKGEVAVARSDDANRVLAYFGAEKPRSGIGSVALARALAALGRQDEARAEAMRGWRELKFDSEAEAAMLAFAGAVVDAENPARMDAILWEGGRAGELQRLIARLPADYAALARARAA